MPELAIRDLRAGDADWARRLIASLQGGTHEVARLGERIDPLSLEGLVAERDGRPAGMAAVRELPDSGLEVVALFSAQAGSGAGTALLETAREVAAASDHHRLWLVTTNDNLPAIHFYLRRGLRVATVHSDAVAADRALKPEIPERNPDNGLPIRDLVEFELAGDELKRPLQTREFPLVEDLDRLPAEAFVRESAVLFEGGEAFLDRLATARPLETDEGLLAAAFEVARGLDEQERVALIQSHPPIGADPATVSALSYAEQGYHRERADPNGADGGDDGDDGEARAQRLADQELADQKLADQELADQELAMLNELYEQRFGFRYVVFVAGRPRSEIVPLLEHALRNEREAELRRAVDDTIYIAADRLRRMRGLGTDI